jgi:hypothetical protein
VRARGEVKATEKEPAMNTQPTQPETTSSRAADESTGGDHDQNYTWGRPPTSYLNYRQVVRLTILRSKLESVRTERLNMAAESA